MNPGQSHCFPFALEWHYINAAWAIWWVSTTSWGKALALQLNGDAAVWVMPCFALSMPIQWSTNLEELEAKYITSNPLNLPKCKWEEHSLKYGECVTELNKCFHCLCSKMDLHQLIWTEMLANAYGYKTKKSNQGEYEDLVCYIG